MLRLPHTYGIALALSHVFGGVFVCWGNWVAARITSQSHFILEEEEREGYPRCHGQSEEAEPVEARQCKGQKEMMAYRLGL